MRTSMIGSLLLFGLAACSSGNRAADATDSANSAAQGTLQKKSSNVCVTAAENENATLTCPPGQTISRISFASYGTPTGDCDEYRTSSCDASNSKQIVEAACVGQATCTVAAANGVFGDPCVNTLKSVAIEAHCADAPAGSSGDQGQPAPGPPVSNDPYDAASCQGEALSTTNVATRFTPGATSTSLGSFTFVRRQRACNTITGCTGWSDIATLGPTPQEMGGSPSHYAPYLMTGTATLEVGSDALRILLDTDRNQYQAYADLNVVGGTNGQWQKPYLIGERDYYGESGVITAPTGCGRSLPGCAKATASDSVLSYNVTTSCLQWIAGQHDSAGNIIDQVAVLLRY